jgi:hypothetical protein
VSAKKHKQEQEGSAGKKERTCSVEPVTLQPSWTEGNILQPSRKLKALKTRKLKSKKSFQSFLL